MTDNSDLQRKIQIRQKGVLLMRTTPLYCCDLYAGEGKITDLFWRHICKDVVAVEKTHGKFMVQAENILLMEQDNRTVELDGFNIFDADAYGMVFPMLKKIASLSGERLVCFTEFNPVLHKQQEWISKFLFQISELDPSALFFEKAKFSAALYGFLYFAK